MYCLTPKLCVCNYIYHPGHSAVPSVAAVPFGSRQIVFPVFYLSLLLMDQKSLLQAIVKRINNSNLQSHKVSEQ